MGYIYRNDICVTSGTTVIKKVYGLIPHRHFVDAIYLNLNDSGHM